MNIFLIAALTADGFIARDAAHLADWTSPEDKKRFVQLTREAGVMIMGATTFATIGRALPGRRTIVYTTHPQNITAEGVETTQEDPKALIARLAAEGVQGVAVCGGAAIYQLFMEAGVVTQLRLTVEPLMFGQGMSLYTKSLDLKLRLTKSHVANDQGTLFLDYDLR